MPENNDEIDDLGMSMKKLISSSIPEELSQDMSKLLPLADLANHSTPAIRDSIDMCSSRMPRGLFRIFAALGKPLLARAAEEVACSATDSDLEGPATTLMDLATVFEAASTDAMDTFQVDCQRAITTLQRIAIQGSRFFKEAMDDRLDRFLLAICHATGFFVDKYENDLDDYLDTKLTRQPEGLESAMKQLMSTRDSLMPAGVVGDMTMVLTCVLEPLASCVQSKGMQGSKGTRLQQVLDLQSRAAMLDKERIAWAALFEVLVVDATTCGDEDPSQWLTSQEVMKDILVQLAVLDGPDVGTDRPFRQANQESFLKTIIRGRLDGKMAQLIVALESDFDSLCCEAVHHLKPSADHAALLLPHSSDALAALGSHSMVEATGLANIIKHVALGAGAPGPIFSCQLTLAIDSVRVSLANFMLIESTEHSGVAANNDIEELFINNNVLAARNAVRAEMLAASTFVDSERVAHPVLDQQFATAKKLLNDAESGFRLTQEKCVSKWTCLMLRLRTNLVTSLPTDWKEFSVTNRDDERITSELLDHDHASRWIGLRASLIQGQQLMKQAYGNLTSPAPVMPKQIDQDNQKVTDEAKMVVGVRAALSVALVKLPDCLTARSKSATLREAKRLLASLDIKDFPVAISNILEESAK